MVTATIAGPADAAAARPADHRQFRQRGRVAGAGRQLFQQTVASGAPTVGVPGDTAFGVIQQGYLEASNVDPVTEITNLISAQRAYEMNSKVIQAADQMSGTISNMRS